MITRNLSHKRKRNSPPKTKEDKWDIRRFAGFIFIMLSASLFCYLHSEETIETKEKNLTLSSSIKLIKGGKSSSRHLVFFVKESSARFEIDQYGIISMDKHNTYADFMSLTSGSVLSIKYDQSINENLNYVIIKIYGLRTNNKIFFGDNDYFITSNKAYKNWSWGTLIISIFSLIYYFRKPLTHLLKI